MGGNQILERTVEIGFNRPQGEVKKFYCDTKDVCAYKQEWINQRCFAPYIVRTTCRYQASKIRAEQLAKE